MKRRIVVLTLITGFASLAGLPVLAEPDQPSQSQPSDKAVLPSIGVPYEPVYGDIVFKRLTGDTGRIPPAIFSHWAHRMRFRCYVCHESIFKMKKGANKVVKDDIRAGRFCGVCHTGKLAWQITDENCHLCHRAIAQKSVAEKDP